MKRIILISLVLFLTVLSACGKPAEPEQQPVPTPDEPNSYSVRYEGGTSDLSGLKVGDRFDWTISLATPGSKLFAGRWLIDYPEEYVKPVGFIPDGNSFPYRDEENDAYSDPACFIINLEYEGRTGDDSFGESGNMYSLLAMYLTGFEHGGVNTTGVMATITFEIVKLPNANELPIPVAVLESCAGLSPDKAVTHGSIEVVPGKLVFGH